MSPATRGAAGWRQWIAWAILLLVFAGGVHTYYVKLLFMDRAPFEEVYRELPYRKLPGFRASVAKAAEVIPAGSSVAFVVPMLEWANGYEYAYGRASYLLAGRRVVPVVAFGDRVNLKRVDETDYLLTYNLLRAPERFEAVWSDGPCTVWRRRP